MVRMLDPEKKEKFLSAALKLFVAQGVQHTTTAEIARAAGTAAGTLFIYFPTKQDLVNALALKIGREQSLYMQAAIHPEHSAREAFLAIWNGSIRWFQENIDAYQFVQQIRGANVLSPQTVAESNQYFAYYYTAIQKGLDEGSIRPYPIELVGGILYQLVVAVMNLLRTETDPTRQEEYIHQGFEIFWNGIKTVERGE
jgi:AcrR family transcriptional regulator